MFALVAGRNAGLLAAQIVEFKPRLAVVATDSVRESLIGRLGETGMPVSAWPELRCDARARIEAASAPEVDFVMSAIVGVAGLEATYSGPPSGSGSDWQTRKCWWRAASWSRRRCGPRAPTDPGRSEHNGAHQCLRAGKRERSRPA